MGQRRREDVGARLELSESGRCRPAHDRWQIARLVTEQCAVDLSATHDQDLGPGVDYCSADSTRKPRTRVQEPVRSCSCSSDPVTRAAREAAPTSLGTTSLGRRPLTRRG